MWFVKFITVSISNMSKLIWWSLIAAPLCLSLSMSEFNVPEFAHFGKRVVLKVRIWMERYKSILSFTAMFECVDIFICWILHFSASTSCHTMTGGWRVWSGTRWPHNTIQDTVADGEVTEPHISDHEWRHKMGQFLHIHPGGAGEGEEADPAQDGRNKYSGKISTQYKQWMLCYKTPKKHCSKSK